MTSLAFEGFVPSLQLPPAPFLLALLHLQQYSTARQRKGHKDRYHSERDDDGQDHFIYTVTFASDELSSEPSNYALSNFSEKLSAGYDELDDMRDIDACDPRQRESYDATMISPGAITTRKRPT